MSGGFFRGTSADQDTRFSNKQAKLLKSQKFAPELEHLVDVRKVKMDVIRPWIATRVTELLGFEDEVLINFIYGLLDGKEVNGKEVQISLTGFMEKNTGKFMKELWGLLLSAQSNESGIPQQFLDAKEEETRKKQAEMDRITSEIQKKKEKDGRDIMGERLKKMDGGADTRNVAAAAAAAMESVTSRGASHHLEDNKEYERRNGVRGRSRFSRSPPSADRSLLSPLDSPRGRKSLSNSQSYSGDRRKSRSRSRSPGTRGRSVSSERGYRSSRKRSISPRKRSPRNSPSLTRKRSSYSRQRSRSPSHRRSPSLMARRRLQSPYRRRSPSPIRRRRSPSPFRRRRSPSPVRRRRSPSPIRRRRSPSPIRRRRSPSPIRRRSPIHRRRSPSPIRRRRSPSPIRGRSRSPVRRRSSSPRSSGSPIPARRRSLSPLGRRPPRSPSTPIQCKSPLSSRRRSQSPHRRSPSPYGYGSPSPVRNKSPLPAAMCRRSPTPSHRRSPSPARRRSFSPSRNRSPKELRRSPVVRERHRSVEKTPPRSLTPPSRDFEKQKDFQDKSPSFSPSPKKSSMRSKSPVLTQKNAVGRYRRSSSPYESPVSKRRGTATNGLRKSPEKQREQKLHHPSPDSGQESEETNYARSSQNRSGRAYSAREQKASPVKNVTRNGTSPSSNKWESRKKDQERMDKRSSGRNEYLENSDEQDSPTLFKDGKRQSVAGESHKSDDRNRLLSNDVKDTAGQNKSKTTATLEKTNHDQGGKTRDSGSEESDKCRTEKKERRKHKRSHKREEASDDADSYDSEIDERKDAKRRKKEERKLRKEEKRRRREERRRRKAERSAEKRKLKDRNYTDSSEDELDRRRDSNPSDDEDTQSQQKRLEIELRKKALESLKAKKGISH